MDRLTEEQQQLAEEAANRANRIAARYARIFPQHADEFKSSAGWAAVQAAESFEPDKGSTWERWSELRIQGEMRDSLRRVSNKKNSVFSITVAEEEVEDHRHLDSDEFESIEWAMSVLAGRSRDLCSLVYVGDMTPEAAGVVLGFSGRQGRNIHNRAIERLRELIAD